MSLRLLAAWFVLSCFAGIATAQEPAPVAANSLGMQFVRLPAGEFTMGLHDQRKLQQTHPNSAYDDADADDRPAFPVRLTQPFEIGRHEVTVGQFKQFVAATQYVTDAERGAGAYVLQDEVENEIDRFVPQAGKSWRDPGFPQTDDHPVTCVSWRDADAFCRWLSEKDQDEYRLPTEAEWEYACRAGTETIYSCGDDPDEVYTHANVADAAMHAVYPQIVARQRVVALSPGQGDGHVYTAPVGGRKPNPWGLYDMHGNVWEWCRDKYSDRIYEDLLKIGREKGSRNDPAPAVDPTGPETTAQHEFGDWRSQRGGSWYVSPLGCRSSVRTYGEAGDAFSYTGFRVVRVVK